MVITAVKCPENICIFHFHGDTLFGPTLRENFNKVLSSSTLFSAHREHAFLNKMGPTPVECLTDPGYLSDVKNKKALLMSLYAQMLYGVADTFTRKFSSMKKASPAVIAESTRDFIAACSKLIVHVQKHLATTSTMFSKLIVSEVTKDPKPPTSCYGNSTNARKSICSCAVRSSSGEG